jgi:hypothetical protein
MGAKMYGNKDQKDTCGRFHASTFRISLPKIRCSRVVLGYLVGFLVIALSAGALPAIAAPICTPQGGPDFAEGFGRDDLNISDLTPCPAEFLAGSGSTTGGSDWIITALNNSGFGPKAGWNFHYATEAVGVSYILDLNIADYYSWAVNEPDVTSPNGAISNGRVHNADAGGAIFILTYVPTQMDHPDPSTVHWVQAFRESINGGGYTITLDGPIEETHSPFYDACYLIVQNDVEVKICGAAGTYNIPSENRIGAWFRDRPLDCETGNFQTCATEEGIEDYHTDVQFNVFLAVENKEIPGDVILYAGYHWGYQYITADISEPGSLYLLLTGTLLLVLARRYTLNRWV